MGGSRKIDLTGQRFGSLVVRHDVGRDKWKQFIWLCVQRPWGRPRLSPGRPAASRTAQVADSIDRIDNNGNYEPGNVRWATKVEQTQNRRCNVNITYRGETACLAEWARRVGVSSANLHYHVVKVGRPLAEMFERMGTTWSPRTVVDDARSPRPRPEG